jgi:hypothetical protein
MLRVGRFPGGSEPVGKDYNRASQDYKALLLRNTYEGSNRTRAISTHDQET